MRTSLVRVPTKNANSVISEGHCAPLLFKKVRLTRKSVFFFLNNDVSMFPGQTRNKRPGTTRKPWRTNVVKGGFFTNDFPFFVVFHIRVSVYVAFSRCELVLFFPNLIVFLLFFIAAVFLFTFASHVFLFPSLARCGAYVPWERGREGVRRIVRFEESRTPRRNREMATAWRTIGSSKYVRYMFARLYFVCVEPTEGSRNSLIDEKK